VYGFASTKTQESMAAQFLISVSFVFPVGTALPSATPVWSS